MSSFANGTLIPLTTFAVYVLNGRQQVSFVSVVEPDAASVGKLESSAFTPAEIG
jgi:hypothetical protein